MAQSLHPEIDLLLRAYDFCKAPSEERRRDAVAAADACTSVPIPLSYTELFVAVEGLRKATRSEWARRIQEIDRCIGAIAAAGRRLEREAAPPQEYAWQKRADLQ